MSIVLPVVQDGVVGVEGNGRGRVGRRDDTSGYDELKGWNRGVSG